MCVSVFSGSMPCYIGVYQCMYGVLYRSVCVGTGGLYPPGCGRAVCVCVAEVCGGGLMFWGLCVFVIKSVRRLWVVNVVVRLDSGNGCLV